MSLNTSRLLNLLVNGTSALNVDPTGAITTASGGNASTFNSGLSVNNAALTLGANAQIKSQMNPVIVSGNASTVSVSVQGGGDNNIASQLGGFVARGANLTGTSVGGTGGAFLQGGLDNSTTAVAGVMFGTAEIVQGFWGGTIAATYDILCGTATQNTLSDCPATSGVNMVGVYMGASNAGRAVALEGSAPVALDAAMTAIGDTVCLSTTTAGKGHDNGSTAACTAAGAQIGVIVANTGAVQVVSPSAVTTALPITATLSTTQPLVVLHFR
jgi:hypothetical protein